MRVAAEASSTVGKGVGHGHGQQDVRGRRWPGGAWAAGVARRSGGGRGAARHGSREEAEASLVVQPGGAVEALGNERGQRGERRWATSASRGRQGQACG
jgi:hypothetical protein